MVIIQDPPSRLTTISKHATSGFIWSVATASSAIFIPSLLKLIYALHSDDSDYIVVYGIVTRLDHIDIFHVAAGFAIWMTILASILVLRFTWSMLPRRLQMRLRFYSRRLGRFVRCGKRLPKDDDEGDMFLEIGEGAFVISDDDEADEEEEGGQASGTGVQ